MDDQELRDTELDNVVSVVIDGSKKLATRNLVPGTSVERVVKVGGEEYRLWDPFHSKLAAAVLKGMSVPLRKDCAVLYLGAASGTTVSHVSDIVSEGVVFAVEFSPRVMQDLIGVSIPRMNLIPIFADAMHPNAYRHMVSDVDAIYQDIAQREQATIAIRNADLFLKKEGFVVLMIKSRSIDSIKPKKDVVRNEMKKLEDAFTIVDVRDLEPFYSDHTAVIAQKHAKTDEDRERPESERDVFET